MSIPISKLRNVAFIGIHHSGKTSLIEALLYLTGAITRRGKTLDGSTTCDSEPEAIARQMSTSVSVAHTSYRDVFFTMLDCPGFNDFNEEVKLALCGVDTAVFVVDPDPDRIAQIEPLLHYTEDIGIARMIFVNKLDKQDTRFDEAIEVLKSMAGIKSAGPAVPIHFPIKDGQSLTGYMDILKSQAFKYGENGKPDAIAIPEHLKDTLSAAHERLIETLADTDDAVLELVVEGKEPPITLLEDDLKKAVRSGTMVPVLVGSGLTDYGVLCLLDAIIALCPSPADHDYRDAGGKAIEVKEDGPAIAQVIKTFVHPQFGKLSLARIFSGTVSNDTQLCTSSAESQQKERVGGLYQLQGKRQDQIQTAGPGTIVAIARLENAKTGDTLVSDKCTVVMKRPAKPAPLYCLSISPKSRADETKLTTTLGKLLDEDPILQLDWDASMHEHLLCGQGDMHLSVSIAKLARKYRLEVESQRPKVAYREAIQSPVEAHGRHKKQTGGHGQFGEVYLKLEPLERGTGNKFTESIVGGAIPRQYIPGVEKGVNEALQRGPLAGYPVVDVLTNLFDGSFHDVDSDEMSFRMAAIQAMREGLSKANPIILEPIMRVKVTVPQSYTSGVLSQITGRRGQILGYEAAEKPAGWDEITANVPQKELWDYIIELRTLSHGLGTYIFEFSHLSPVPANISEELKTHAVAA